jgi:hypothetical protein
MNLPIKFLVLTTLALLTSLCYASEESATLTENKAKQKWYQVEVIIFTQKDAFADELSTRDIVLTYPENLIELDNNRAGFTALPKSKRELGPDAYSLNRTGVYKTLYHRAWLQPGLAPENAPWINIDRSDDNTALGGSLRVYLSSYLHMESNIWRVSYATEFGSSQHAPLNAPSQQLNSANNTGAVNIEGDEEVSLEAAPLQAPWPEPPTPLLLSTEPKAIGDESSTLLPAPRAIEEIILLKQESRLKLDKLHYFDHPKLGVLVKISRAKPVTVQAIAIEPVDRIESVEKPAVEDSLNEKPTIKESPAVP